MKTLNGICWLLSGVWVCLCVALAITRVYVEVNPPLVLYYDIAVDWSGDWSSPPPQQPVTYIGAIKIHSDLIIFSASQLILMILTACIYRSRGGTVCLLTQLASALYVFRLVPIGYRQDWLAGAFLLLLLLFPKLYARRHRQLSNNEELA